MTAVSVALVALVLPLLRASDPPTTLLASLGLLDELNQLAWVMGGVLLLSPPPGR